LGQQVAHLRDRYTDDDDDDDDDNNEYIFVFLTERHFT
jgi:hypothetical protein